MSFLWIDAIRPTLDAVIMFAGPGVGPHPCARNEWRGPIQVGEDGVQLVIVEERPCPSTRCLVGSRMEVQLLSGLKIGGAGATVFSDEVSQGRVALETTIASEHLMELLLTGPDAPADALGCLTWWLVSPPVDQQARFIFGPTTGTRRFGASETS